jgi:hypothetical protein
MTNDIDINNFEWQDIVITIPKNTVHIIADISVFDNGKIVKCQGEYNVNDINDCKNTLEKYIDGDLPLYVLTDKEKELLEYGSI